MLKRLWLNFLSWVKQVLGFGQPEEYSITAGGEPTDQEYMRSDTLRAEASSGLLSPATKDWMIKEAAFEESEIKRIQEERRQTIRCGDGCSEPSHGHTNKAIKDPNDRPATRVITGGFTPRQEVTRVEAHYYQDPLIALGVDALFQQDMDSRPPTGDAELTYEKTIDETPQAVIGPDVNNLGGSEVGWDNTPTNAAPGWSESNPVYKPEPTPSYEPSPAPSYEPSTPSYEPSPSPSYDPPSSDYGSSSSSSYDGGSSSYDSGSSSCDSGSSGGWE